MIDKKLIMNDSFNRGLGIIGYCYSNLSSTLLITGESGVGKTTLIYESINRLEKNDTPKTILSTNVPLPLNTSNFLSNLLRDIGDARYDRGNSQEKKQRLISWIKDGGIKLMVIDDFQHIIKWRALSIEVIGMLKEILKDTGISLVAVALPNINKDRGVLVGLFQRELHLNEIPYQTVEDKVSFKSILNDIEKQLGFEKSSDLSEFSNEIIEVTNGNLTKIMTLITGAEFLAKINKEPNITLEYLYLSSDVMYGIPKANPIYNRLIREAKNKGELSRD